MAKSAYIDMSDFTAARIDDAMDDVEKTVETYVRRGSLGALSHMVLASPVDTGRFRAAWLVSLNAPVSNAPTAYADAVKNDPRYPNDAISTGSGVINSYKDYSVVIIQNNVEYAAILNDGTSSRPPGGFVESGINAAFGA